MPLCFSNLIIFSVIPNLGFGIVCFTYDAYFDNPTSTLDYKTFRSLAKLEANCSSCKKTFTQANAPGLVPVVQSWICEKSSVAQYRPGRSRPDQCKESVYVDYSNDDDIINTRTCICCSDACNTAEFCDHNDKTAVEIRRKISRFKTKSSTNSSTLQCFNASISSGDPDKATKIRYIVKNCQECKKSSLAMTYPGRFSEGWITEDQWECTLSSKSVASSTCVTRVTGHIYLDGSLSNLQCTCCEDQCNTEDFCSLDSFIPSTSSSTESTPSPTLVRTSNCPCNSKEASSMITKTTMTAYSDEAIKIWNWTFGKRKFQSSIAAKTDCFKLLHYVLITSLILQ